MFNTGIWLVFTKGIWLVFTMGIWLVFAKVGLGPGDTNKLSKRIFLQKITRTLLLSLSQVSKSSGKPYGVVKESR